MDAHLDWRNNLVIMTNEFQSCAGNCGFQGSSFHVCILDISQSLATVLGGTKKKTLTRECLKFRILLPEGFQSLQNCFTTALVTTFEVFGY